jgi:hypothetical protein
VKSLSLAAAGTFALAALAFSAGTASADTNPGPYLVNGTAYFNVGGRNCSITSSGVVGCDVTPTAMFMDVTVGGTQIPVPYAPAIVIDSPALPGHPDWFGAGSDTLAGGNPALPNLQPPHYGDPTQSITYAGAHCDMGFHGAVDCTSMGHTISFTDGQVFGS